MRKCEIDVGAPAEGSKFASVSWEERAKRLRECSKTMTDKVEGVREKDGDVRANDLASLLLPQVSPGPSFRKYGNYNRGKFVYKVRRWGRVRDPIATSLLAAYSRYLSRDAHEHDFSAVRLD